MPVELRRAIVTITIQKDGQNSGFVPADLAMLMGEDVNIQAFGKKFGNRGRRGDVPEGEDMNELYSMLDDRMSSKYISRSEAKQKAKSLVKPE